MVLMSQHIPPLRILGVWVSKISHCVGSHIGLLKGILLVSPAVSTLDGSAKSEGENHARVGAMLSHHQQTVCPVERSAILTSLWPLTPDFLPPALCCLLCQSVHLTLKQHNDLKAVCHWHAGSCSGHKQKVFCFFVVFFCWEDKKKPLKTAL